MRRRTERDDHGSTIPLIVGFALVLIMLIAVVVDVSAAYLRRQGLDSVADGAALQGADLGATGLEVYGGGISGEQLRLTESAIRRSVQDYLHTSGAYARYPGLTLTAVHLSRDARHVSVSLRTSVKLPLHLPGAPQSATVTATGSAAVDIDR